MLPQLNSIYTGVDVEAVEAGGVTLKLHCGIPGTTAGEREKKR